MEWVGGIQSTYVTSVWLDLWKGKLIYWQSFLQIRSVLWRIWKKKSRTEVSILQPLPWTFAKPILWKVLAITILFLMFFYDCCVEYIYTLVLTSALWSSHKFDCKIHMNYMVQHICNWHTVNVINSPPGQNGRHFADDIFICIVVNEKFLILIKISLKFILKGPIDNNSALV